MAWVKLDDQFFVNRKARSVGLEGRALFLASICYCGMQLNDGVFPMADLPVIAALAEVPVDVADRLFGCDMWHLSDDKRLVEVHDYLTWNRSRRQVVAAEEAGRKAAHAKHAADRTAKRTTDRSAEPSGESELDPDETSSHRRPGNSRGNGSRPDDDEISTVPADTWTHYADLKLPLERPGTVRSAVKWKATTARNARTELGPQAADWWHRYDFDHNGGAYRLAQALVAGEAPRIPRRNGDT